MRALRVATYNIHKGVAAELFGFRRAATLHELRLRLHELDADLIFLQEVQGRHDRHARRIAHWPSEIQGEYNDSTLPLIRSHVYFNRPWRRHILGI